MRKRCFALVHGGAAAADRLLGERTADPGGEPAVSPESAGEYGQ